MSTVLAKATVATRVAPGVECAEEEALNFWDYGMLYAFDIIEQRMQELTCSQQLIAVADVLRILAIERGYVKSEGLQASLQNARGGTDEIRR